MRSSTVIQRVRQIMAEGPGSSAEDGSSMAVSYAALCSQANERLRGCVDCLKRGMVSEALRIAETEPVLLDLCGELDFVGVENWAGLCEQRKWVKPEPIDGKAIQALNEAYSSGQALEPLLKEFRRVVRDRKTKEAVRLLRRVATLDKANQNWVSDLRSFEERRITEIRTEFEIAKSAEDVETLAALMVELNDNWTIPRDLELKESVRSAARGLYEKQALLDGRLKLQNVANAYAALNFDKLAPEIASYELLLRDGYLKPDSAMVTQYEEAKEWLEHESKLRREEQLYLDTLEKLRSAVEKGTASKLGELLNTISRFNRTIPDRLEERALDLIETHKIALERVQKRKIATAAILLLLIGAAIAGVIFRQRFDKEKTQLLSVLEQAYQSEDLDNFSKALTIAEKKNTRIFHDSEVQVWAQKKTQLESLLGRKKTSYEHAVSRLESFRENGFSESRQVVEALIEEGRANVTPGAAQGRLASFLREWNAHNEALQEETDKVASSKIDEFTRTMGNWTKISEVSPNGARPMLEELREQGRRIDQSIEKASSEQKGRMTAILIQLDALINQMDGKERQLEIARTAKTLREYLDAIKTYSRAFPEDTISKCLAGTLIQEANYNHMLESPSSCTSNNPFWFTSYQQRCEVSRRSTENWPIIKSRLMELETEKKYISLWECDTLNGKVYIEGKPTEGFSRGVKAYEGMIYIPNAQDIQPDFKQQSLEASTVWRANLMPHCEFVLGLVSMARFSKESTAYDDLVIEMQKLSTNSNISPLLKLRLMDMLVGCLTDLVGDDLLPEWKPLRRDLKSVDQELHWLCLLHRDVIRANKDADEKLKRYFPPSPFIKQLRFMSAVQNASLSRNVNWVGYAGLTNGANIVLKTKIHPKELWVARNTDDGFAHIFLAAEYTTNQVIQYVSYLPGEPLFTPIDGLSTRTILASLKTKCDLRDTKQLNWVNSWPLNFHQ